jgi:hypothetical protein
MKFFAGWISLALKATKSQTLLANHLIAANATKLPDAKLTGNFVFL